MSLSHRFVTEAALLRAAAAGDGDAFDRLRQRTWKHASVILSELGLPPGARDSLLAEAYEQVHSALLAGRGPTVELTHDVVSRTLRRA